MMKNAVSSILSASSLAHFILACMCGSLIVLAISKGGRMRVRNLLTSVMTNLRPVFAGWSTSIKNSRPLTSIGKPVVALTLGFTIGYLYRTKEQYDRTNTLFDVGIVARHSTFDYTLRYHGTEFETAFCQDYLPTFEPGEKLQFITYQDKIVCWDISDRTTGFKYYRGRDGKAIQFAELKP